MQQLPAFLSLVCIVVGVVWLLLLPLDQYSRPTYISENALLPGQVHTYFGGSEQNIFRAFRHEVQQLAERDADADADAVVERLAQILQSAGLKVGRQRYEYVSAGQRTSGQNVYAILHAPRGDATEAVVLAAAWRNAAGELNQSGVALLLTLARYFKRWSLWSKDIIFLVTEDSWAGPQAWADAYHDGSSSSSSAIGSLPIKSGALQAVVAIDYPSTQRFESIHVVYDGINGQLPNLDLVNTAAAIASGQMGIGVCLQRMWTHDDRYPDRLRTMLRGMFSQGLGHASGPHSSFIPYRVDAITLQAVVGGRDRGRGHAWHDEMALGRTVESIFRSLNNLLEHFHQSFFLYLLMQPNRFVSIGTYLPSAMLVAVNFTIMAIALWIESGRPPPPVAAPTPARPSSEEQAARRGAVEEVVVVQKDGMTAVVLPQSMAITERRMFLPLAVVLGIHVLGLIPLHLFNHSTAENLLEHFTAFTLLSTLLIPSLLALLLTRYLRPTVQQQQLMRCFSLLLLGMVLSALATVNFSLALLIGLASSPLSFLFVLRPLAAGSAASRSSSSASSASWLTTAGATLLMHLCAPPVLLASAAAAARLSVREGLVRAAFAWHVWRVWVPAVVVWLVWWPAWLVAMMLWAMSFLGPAA